MKRRTFLTNSLVGGLGAAALGAESKAEPKVEPDADGKPLLASPAVIMAPRSDGVEIVWAVNRFCHGWVEWREPGGQAVRCGADDFGFVPQGDWVLRQRLAGLRPGATYEARVIVETAGNQKTREESAWKKFRTLDPAAAEAHFVVWNDTHEHAETLQRLHQLTPPADFLIWNGDTCGNNWDQLASMVPALLTPGGQDVTEGRPLLLAWGNHDTRGKWAYKVREIMATPQGRPFSAFRCGPVAAITLHTGEDKPDDHPSFGGRVAMEVLRREQADWLITVTATPEIRNAPYKVVFCHIPLRWTREPATLRYDAGDYDFFSRASRTLWHDALVAWGAQVIISAHTHSDAWLPPNENFPYAQMVSGGPETRGARWIDGKADASGLKLTMRDLAGKTIREQIIAPARL